MKRPLQKLHVVRSDLFHYYIADHVEVGEITGCPQKDNFQAPKNQHHLDRSDAR